LTREANLKLTRAGFAEAVVLQAFVCAGEETYWSANEVVVEFAVPYTIDFVLVDKTRMDEINNGNKHVMTVTPLMF
jgi:hypothetical protein